MSETLPPEIELTLEREVSTQTEVIVCRLTTFEGARRMTSLQFQANLDRILQRFAAEIMTAWEKTR